MSYCCKVQKFKLCCITIRLTFTISEIYLVFGGFNSCSTVISVLRISLVKVKVYFLVSKNECHNADIQTNTNKFLHLYFYHTPIDIWSVANYIFRLGIYVKRDSHQGNPKSIYMDLAFPFLFLFSCS